ncbi:uncharacterized protein [Chiloscyllium punctatum]|uniref:uncharacterized protein n=1 Tax=Chiloscyllium punctatum TaxID=137246 RepID=UPI003B64150D
MTLQFVFDYNSAAAAKSPQVQSVSYVLYDLSSSYLHSDWLNDHSHSHCETYIKEQLSLSFYLKQSHNIAAIPPRARMGNASTNFSNTGNITVRASPNAGLRQASPVQQAADKTACIYIKNDTNNIELTDPEHFIVKGKLLSTLENVEKGKEKTISFMEGSEEGCAGILGYQCGDNQLLVLFYKPSTYSDTDPPVCVLSIQDKKVTLNENLYKTMLQEEPSSSTTSKKSIREIEYLQILKVKNLQITCMLEGTDAISVTIKNEKSHK